MGRIRQACGGTRQRSPRASRAASERRLAIRTCAALDLDQIDVADRHGGGVRSYGLHRLNVRLGWAVGGQVGNADVRSVSAGVLGDLVLTDDAPDGGPGSGSVRVAARSRWTGRAGMTMASSATTIAPNSTATAGSCASCLPASSMTAPSVASLVSSVKPMPCTVRCSHWSGISVAVGAAATADRYESARRYSSGWSSKVTWKGVKAAPLQPRGTVGWAGLVDVTPHDLRATHGSWVADSHGVLVAARRLGHANASVTTRHYARAVDGRDAEVAQHLHASRAKMARRSGTHAPKDGTVIGDQGPDLVPPAGFEPATHGLGNRCSIP